MNAAEALSQIPQALIRFLNMISNCHNPLCRQLVPQSKEQSNQLDFYSIILFDYELIQFASHCMTKIQITGSGSYSVKSDCGSASNQQIPIYYYQADITCHTYD